MNTTFTLFEQLTRKRQSLAFLLAWITSCLAFSATAQTVSFPYTGSVQPYTVPAGVTSLNVQLYGAQGGGSAACEGFVDDDGGLGGFASGTLAVVPGQVLYIYVGGQPTAVATGYTSAITPGGFNGGGSFGYFGGGGGGASDIRLNGTALNNRVIVAGGGGGGNTGCPNYGTGGAGGGVVGADGISNYSYQKGLGGSQNAGGTGVLSGTLGQGGGANGYHIAGGGGGYYGGGSGFAAGAGGGSSYLGGVINGSTTAGLRTSSGLVTLTVLNVTTIATNFSGGSTCAGAPLNVPFTAAGTFNAGNSFTAQLSDASGSFASPTAIGTLAGTASGSISASIPAATPAGSGYRVRVVSSNPVITGTDNGSNITINTAPVVTAPANITANSSASQCGASVAFVATATGSSAPTMVYSVDGAPITSPHQFALGTTLVTATATNTCGSDAKTFTVTVEDHTAPVARANDIAVQLNASGNASITGAQLNNGSTDNCSVASVTVAPSTFTCANAGANPVVLTVTDASGNVSTANATVTVLDQIAPTALAKNITAQLNANGTATVTATQLNNGSSDNCGPVTFTIPATQGSVGGIVGENGIVTLTAPAGTVFTAVTFASYGSPTGTPGAFTTGGCHAPTSRSIIEARVLGQNSVSIRGDNATFGDPCVGTVKRLAIQATYSATAPAAQRAFTCANLGANAVTLTVTDASGNQSTASAIVTVVDQVLPTITAPAAVAANTNPGQCSASNVALGSATAADNCSATVTNNAPATFPKGMTTVTWTATDASGNKATATQLVTVTDNELPTITAPAAVTVSTDAGQCTASNVALGTATASDNCTGTTVTNNAPASFPKGNTTVTWTATDASGNVATATQTVTVNDTELPTIAAPAAVTANTDLGQCSATQVALGAPIAGDNCTGVVVTNDAPAAFAKGNTTVTWTATDAAGLVATATQVVTVNDAELPTIAAPAAVTVSTDAGQCSASGVALGQATAGDNCAGVMVTNNAPAVFAKGTTTVTWTATDASGNVATATQEVTVNDTELPTISAPAAITASTDLGQCSATNVALGSPVAGDNCTGVVVTNDAPASFAKGTTTVTWTATDAAGLVATATQMVMVSDTELPTIAVPAAKVVSTDAGQCSASNVALGSATAGDNCAGVVVTNNAPAVFAKGATTVIWTATDAAGNYATASQVVTVNDTENPTVLAPAAVTVSTGRGQCSASGVALGTPTAGDNCAGVTVSSNAPTTFPKGTTTVTWTATDAAGNTATATQVVIVNDTERPVLTVPANIAVNAPATLCGAVVTFTPIATDNCAAMVVASPASGSTFPVGTSTVTVKATDAAGNASTGSFTVTVSDVTAPAVITRNVTVTLVNGTASVTPAQVNNGSTDACLVQSVTLNKTAFTCASLGTNDVILTVTDNHGNSATGPAVVTVVGALASPTIVATPASLNIGKTTVIYLGYGSQTATLTASGGVSYVWNAAPGLSTTTGASTVFTPTAEGMYTFTVTATNQYGCTGTVTIKVYVEDVHCGNGGDKVQICHNGNAICVSYSALNTHLAHGDKVGDCTVYAARGAGNATTAIAANELSAFPNPVTENATVSFRTALDGPAQVVVYNQLGQRIATLYDGAATAGKLYSLTLKSENLATGLYVCRLVTNGKTEILRLTVAR